METVPLFNNTYSAGVILEISAPIQKGTDTVVNLVLDCENQDGSAPIKKRYLAIKAWNKHADNLRDFKIGDHVQVRVMVLSKRNLEHRALWYHVVSLKEIFKA